MAKTTNEDLNQELKSAVASLKMQSFKGCVTECPECKRRGYFGSVVNYETEKDGNFILCGWCGAITKEVKE